MHWKTPGSQGGEFGYHQDIRFRRPREAYRAPAISYVQTGIAIDPHHRGNGAMTVLPGSHQRGELQFTADGRVMDRSLTDADLRGARARSRSQDRSLPRARRRRALAPPYGARLGPEPLHRRAPLLPQWLRDRRQLRSRRVGVPRRRAVRPWRAAAGPLRGSPRPPRAALRRLIDRLAQEAGRLESPMNQGRPDGPAQAEKVEGLLCSAFWRGRPASSSIGDRTPLDKSADRPSRATRSRSARPSLRGLQRPA